MKFLILFCAVLALAFGEWTPHTREQFFKDREECFQELKISEEDVEKIRRSGFLEDSEAMCYVRCIGIKSGTWDDAEGFNVDRIYETFTRANMEVSKENLEKCFGRVMDVSTCQWAAINMRCLWDNKYITRKIKPKE